MNCLNSCVEFDDILIYKLIKIVIIYSVSDIFHQTVVKMEIVHNAESHCKHLFAFKQMSDISSRKFLANRAAARRINRGEICLIFIIIEIFIG